MVHKKRHHFLALFSIPFHMVWSALLRVVAQKTTFWLVEIFWQPIRCFYSMVCEATTRNKMKHIMWKGMENYARKWCLFLCTIFFEVTWAFCKTWSTYVPEKECITFGFPLLDQLQTCLKSLPVVGHRFVAQFLQWFVLGIKLTKRGVFLNVSDNTRPHRRRYFK